ncbi:hypothetical protein [Agrobacterium salinitolerans]|uniref:hypothetical protein n=1 Tax=Agrobacterium salinitolerans TaxID=1183413 RepID=UPI0015743DBB|nr:hypothetical protein [Agrobacterium salinitolerans]
MARKQKYLATPEGKAKRELGAKWIARVEAASKLEKDWLDDAQMATKAYTNEEKAEATERTLGKRYDFNILFSNVETIVPAVINSSPVPDIRRRFNDPDPAARVVSDILERAISVQIDDSRLQVELEAAAQDAFLAGRGIVRIKFHGDVVGGEPDKEELQDAANEASEGLDSDDSSDGGNGTMGEADHDSGEDVPGLGQAERLENERIRFEAVSWKDYLFNLQRQMDNDPINTLMQIADTYELRPHLQQMFGGTGEGGDTGSAALLAKISQLENTIRSMGDPSRIDERITSKLSEDREVKEIDDLLGRTSKDMPLYDQIPEPDLVSFIHMAKQKLGGSASKEAVLKRAYDMAVNADPDLRAKAAALKNAAGDDPAKVAAAKRANATNLRSTSSGRGRDLTEEEELAAVYDKHKGN